MKTVIFIIFFIVLSAYSYAQSSIGEIEVIGSSPVPGLLIEKKKLPNTIQSIKNDKIKENLTKSITDLMNENLSGLSVKDVQNGSFQKNVDYRGFTASPLLGEPQGLAIYLDGIRINESFGDTVQWELIPENSINQIDLMSSNPAFGLNALGGSLALTTKKGLDFRNSSYLNNVFKMGSFAYHSEAMEYGLGNDNSGVYASLELEEDNGWRDHSDGKIKRFFGNYGLENLDTDLNISLINASTDLNGNGVSPIELLKKDRKSVFTWPDNTSNTLTFLYANHNKYLKDESLLSTNLYFKRLNRKTLNADEVDAEECAEDSAADATEIKNDYGLDDAPLCGEDNSAGDYGVLLDQNGNVIESNDDIRKYGLLNKTFTTTNTFGGAMQYDSIFNYKEISHNFSLGLSYDQARTFFRSSSFLGQLTNERTVNQLFNSSDQPIELVSEQEHSGNGGDPDEKERGDVGPAEIEGKLNLYGLYVNDNFSLNDKITFSVSNRFNLAFVELIDKFETDIYTRTFKINGDHRYFRSNPSFGVVYNLNSNFSIIGNYKEANRAPSPVELSCADPSAPCRLPNAFVADPPLEQVVSRGIEFGIRGQKSSDSSKNNWSAVGHFTQNNDDILFVSSGTGVSSGFFKNFGKTNRLGFDFNYSLNNIIPKYNFISGFFNYSFLKATFQSAHTLPAANHPNGKNDIEAGDIIPGMPEHRINGEVTFEVIENNYISLGGIASSGVFLRGDESNQLKKTSPYAIFNLEAKSKLRNNINLFGRIDNIFNSKYETMGVLGEASSSEINVPISELGDTGSGDTAVGALDPNFLSPGQPISIFIGGQISW